MSLLAIVVSESPQVGIDLEPVPNWTYADVTWDALSPRESAIIEALPAIDRYRAFLKVWTVKEAYTKCLGVGVSLDFRDLDVAFNPLRVAARAARDVLGLHQYEVAIGGDNYLLALAMRR